MKYYVFLTSANFSGSTLLSFLMDSHPNIASVGELSNSIRGMNMETYQCSCGSRLVDCQFWLEVRKQMTKQNLPFEFHNFQTAYFSRGVMEKALFYPFKWNRLNYIRDMFFQLERRRIKHVENVSDRCVAMAKVITKLRNTDHFFDASKSYIKPKYL